MISVSLVLFLSSLVAKFAGSRLGRVWPIMPKTIHDEVIGTPFAFITFQLSRDDFLLDGSCFGLRFLLRGLHCVDRGGDAGFNRLRARLAQREV